MLEKGKKIVALLLLLLFAGYWSCITLFPHAHRIDGHVIVHSHPFAGKANAGSAGHSPQQLLLIAHLSLLIATQATEVFCAMQLAGREFLSQSPEPQARRSLPVVTPGLRAPPVRV